MGGRARISHQQLICAAFITKVAAATLYLPTAMVKLGRNGGWVAPLVAIALGALPASLLVGTLVRRHPGYSPGEMATQLLGNWAARLFTLLLALYSLYVSVLAMRDVTEFIPTAILPATPTLAISLTFMLAVVYGAYSGAEVISRLAVVSTILLLSGLALVGVTVIGLIQPLNLLPVADRGLGQVLSASWPPIGFFAECWALFPFVGMLDKGQTAVRGLVLGAVVGGVYLAIETALVSAVFGVDFAETFTFSGYTLTQQVSIGEFVERLDIILVNFWMISMVAKLSIHFWTAVTGASYTLGLKNERILLLPLGAILIAWTEYRPDITSHMDFSIHMWPYISLGFSIGLPGLLLVASWVRAHRSRTRSGMGA